VVEPTLILLNLIDYNWWLLDCGGRGFQCMSVARPEAFTIIRDQPNSRCHGRDIFREIDRLPWNWPISVKSMILTFLLSFTKVSIVLSTAFARVLLFTKWLLTDYCFCYSAAWRYSTCLSLLTVLTLKEASVNTPLSAPRSARDCQQATWQIKSSSLRT